MEITTNKGFSTRNLVFAGLLTAAGVMLPSLFHTVGMSGSIFLPMHIPVLLCGLICGFPLGILSGLLIPLLCSMMTGMPPLYPVAIYMACELMAYGALTGIFRKKFPVLVTLVIAAIGGRIVLGVAQAILMGVGGTSFGIQAFLTSAFVTALPGILIQLVTIPLIMVVLRRAKVVS